MEINQLRLGCYQNKFRRSAHLLLLVLAGLFLVGCGVRSTGTWPGLSASANKVYVAYGSSVTAVDLENRRQLWAYTGEAGGVQFFAPPSVNDGNVIIGDFGTSGGMFSSGLTVSVYALQEDGSSTSTDWVVSDQISGRVFAEPLRVGDKVIIGTSDNQIVALDVETGQREWAFETGNAIWSQPALQDGMLYVSSVDRKVYALDVESGDLRWDVTLSGANAGSPEVGDGLLYVGSFDATLHAYDLADGSPVWEATAEDWIWGAPTYANGRVYYTDKSGNVFAVDAESGESIWQTAVDGEVHVEPVFQDGVLYVVGADPTINEAPDGYVSALDADTGSPIWQQTIDHGPVHTAPVLVNDSLVVATVDSVEQTLRLVQLDLDNGSELWDIAPTAE